MRVEFACGSAMGLGPVVEGLWASLTRRDDRK